ncbi:hypothetical protein [Paenibacillus macquariensis]|uniref:Uncharacterized protein n=1 Tax=Paenibacillus macquariensis TaxID=948756 RepID=A0ABY1JMD9_9BACL|nr:hypothetical protein [Paenibacillus macquariensis]MEC0090646.1 hypothetical protein [Paenibacillus macquariensis]OAB25058.1 hypothetical protein PMSM_28945 [Paenibacillus macquariensis subsp. macquariensis]SIQ45672.1 hypothetical protein SAMN05421578_10274 [Paenibacillus macquariensis]
MKSINIPDLYELEYLFECNAQVTDEEVGWYYSGVSFVLERDLMGIEFYLIPAIRSGSIRISINRDTIIDIDLENIIEITIKRDNQTEVIEMNFDQDNFVQPLIVQTKPIIKAKWGTLRELNL